MAAAVLERQAIVSCLKSFYFRYFGWPTVARPEDGALAPAEPGFRRAHMRPWGKSAVRESIAQRLMLRARVV